MLCPFVLGDVSRFGTVSSFVWLTFPKARPLSFMVHRKRDGKARLLELFSFGTLKLWNILYRGKHLIIELLAKWQFFFGLGARLSCILVKTQEQTILESSSKVQQKNSVSLGNASFGSVFVVMTSSPQFFFSFPCFLCI